MTPACRDAALTTHDRGDSDDVVGIRGVTNTKNKSQTDCCREIHHAALSQFHRLNRFVAPAFLQQQPTISSYS